MSLKLTHVEKIYWPKEKITKGDLLDYYAAITPFILPYLKNRPVVMHRFPEGIQGESFYQKDVKEVPSFVKTAEVAHKERDVNYIVIQNQKSLLYVVNLGSIELHPFSSTLRRLGKPDYLVMDLDPEGVSFNTVVDVALQIHEILETVKIPHFCKTSGGSGLHIYIPVGGKYPYEQIRRFATFLAQLTNEKLPKITSLERNPKKRQRKVYLDTLQNAQGQLVACPYSARAFPHAPVSTPLAWNEVRHGLRPEEFTIQNVPARVARKGDFFKGVLGKGINLQACLKKLGG